MHLFFIEKEVLGFLTLIEKYFTFLQTDWNDFHRSVERMKDYHWEMLGSFLTKISFFQLHTGLCVICEKFSTYQSKMVKLICIMKNLFVRFTRDYSSYFPSATVLSVQALTEFKEQLFADLSRQLRLDAAPSYKTCDCVQLPRRGLDKIHAKVVESQCQLIDTLSPQL